VANPKDSGTFDYWVTDRIAFDTAVPKSGDTGDYEKWYTDRIRFQTYVEAVIAAGLSIPVAIATYRRRRVSWRS
jgi:hypothetical protein